MNLLRIVPQLRENRIVQGKENWLSNFEVGDTKFLISDLPTKTYSIISKIEELKYANAPKLFVDKRNLSLFEEYEEVFILKYNTADALEVHLDISSDNTMSIN
jgi:hypothetical protein